MTRTDEEIRIYIVQSGVMTGYANNTIKADVLTQMHSEREAILDRSLDFITLPLP